ncbi:hypothetical protein BKA64DRAFT_710218 [Cadophora sp. MPI-SDFR-AT-0126]|nr:hypothetical protein BKA64DRAFT_710218 [Leotiomycetes sp. MPI-SDFR-AT-0126]
MSQLTTSSTTTKSREDHIRESLFALLGLWFTTIILHAIFLSPYYTMVPSPYSQIQIPTQLSIPCINLDNSTISIPVTDSQPCTLKFTAVDSDPWGVYDALGFLGFFFSVGWIASLVSSFYVLEKLQEEDGRFKTVFMAIGSGVLGLVWVMFEPFGWEERNVKGYIESFILPVGLVVSLAVAREISRTYRPIPHGEERAEAEGDIGSGELTQQERRHGDLEAGRA